MPALQQAMANFFVVIGLTAATLSLVSTPVLSAGSLRTSPRNTETLSMMNKLNSANEILFRELGALQSRKGEGSEKLVGQARFNEDIKRDIPKSGSVSSSKSRPPCKFPTQMAALVKMKFDYEELKYRVSESLSDAPLVEKEKGFLEKVTPEDLQAFGKEVKNCKDGCQEQEKKLEVNINCEIEPCTDEQKEEVKKHIAVKEECMLYNKAEEILYALKRLPSGSSGASGGTGAEMDMESSELSSEKGATGFSGTGGADNVIKELEKGFNHF